MTPLCLPARRGWAATVEHAAAVATGVMVALTATAMPSTIVIPTTVVNAIAAAMTTYYTASIAAGVGYLGALYTICHAVMSGR